MPVLVAFMCVLLLGIAIELSEIRKVLERMAPPADAQPKARTPEPR